MGAVYVWDDSFPTDEEYKNAYKRGMSVMKLMDGEKQYEGINHTIDPRTDMLHRQKYRITYELRQLSIFGPVGNIGFLSVLAFIDVNEIYNLTTNEKITDEHDVPKRFIEDFKDQLYDKLHSYFRLISDIEIEYKGIS
jgi:hypothetical protein